MSERLGEGADPKSSGRRRGLWKYALAMAVLSAAFALRWSLDPVLGDRCPFYLFLPAVIGSAWFCGAGPAALVTVLGFLLGDLFFGTSRGSFTLPNRSDQIAAGIYLASASCSVVLVRRIRIKYSQSVTELLAPALGPETIRWNAAEYRRGKTNVVLVFMAAIAVLGASLVFMFQAGHISFQAVQKMGEQRLVLDRLDQTLSCVTDAETGERGYLLTGEEPYLEPYQQALPEMDSKLAELRAMASNGSLPKQEVERLAQLAGEKLAALKQAIAVRRERGLDAALVLVRSGAGREVMDEIRHVINELRTGARADFTVAASRAHRARIVRTMIYLMAGLVNLGFLGWASRKVSHQMDALGRGKELLATTLGSIGDGVIVTDTQARVTFMNGEAEHLTGWKSSEAIGEPLPRIFNIVNERTRQLVENPVDKALRLGAVVGLVNHTLLLRRDGTEIPIDDSAAPIRQPDGPLFGVVLIFRDFTTQKQIEEQLEKTVRERTAKLQEMVSELQHVSYAIVHDMRAPLRAMQSFAQMLNQEVMEGQPAERIEHARRIITAAHRLDRLIQDALIYNKAVLEEPRLEPVDLTRLLRGLIDTYPNLDPIFADILIDTNLPVVMGSEALLTQCFSNLLGNAVKFVAPGTRPRVCVRAECHDGCARIWVEDNGVGIPEIAHKRLFGLFQRLTGETEGTGAGLAIVRKLTERMGGQVGAESEPGKGSRFWMELRVAQNEEISAPAVAAHPVWS